VQADPSAEEVKETSDVQTQSSHFRCSVARRRADLQDRGIDVDFQPNLGKDKDKLAEIIGNYDGLAIRSATKATARSSRRRRG